MPTTYEAKRGPWSGGDTPASGDDDMLRRINERYEYLMEAWKPSWDQAEKDDRCLSTSGPWSEEERAARKLAKRPCIHLDQVSQYIHALVNEARSNPIGIDVNPAGDGANEDTAELRANRVRQIEYESNAIQAYLTALESAGKRGFGYAGIKIEYKSWDSDERVIKIRRFPNSYSVLVDFDTSEVDGSDMADAFVLTRMSHSQFKREFPNAQTSSFGTEHIDLAPSWIDDDSVQVAEYWYKDYKKRHQIVMNGDQGEKIIDYLDSYEGAKVKGKELVLKDGTAIPILSDRIVHQPQIKMCLTNGIELLAQENDEKIIEWPGKWIPIGICFGEEDYYRSGDTVKRDLKSHIRRARDGQMLFDFNKSNEAEVIGMSPKVPFIIYEGQDAEHEQEWQNVNKKPVSVLHVKATTAEIPNQILPLPQRQVFEPPIQALELGAESARRAIQASVASYGFTRLDDTNVKSGVALDRLKSQNQLGSYHFIDNYKVFIRHMGRMINDLLDDVEGDSRATVGTRDRIGKYNTVKLNQQEEGKVNAYRLNDKGQHEVTITTGPSFQSQREEAVALVDVLVQNLDKLPVDPPTKSRIMALLIELKQLGPIGDQLVQTFAPDPGKIDPARLVQELQQWQQLAEQLGQKVQQLEQELKLKTSIKQMDNETRLQIAAMNADIEKLKAMIEASNKQSELDSREAIAFSDQEVKREAKEIDKDIEQMKAKTTNRGGKES